MASTMVNGANTADATSINNTTSATVKQPTKANPGSKGGDGARKPVGPSNEGAQRKPTPQKAWQTGMNPITQRSTTPAAQNGNISQPRAAPQKPASNMELANADKHARDRLLFLMSHFMGLSTTVTVKNGEAFSGIFFGASLEGTDQAYLLKMVQKVRSNDKVEPNGSPDACGDFIGSGEDYDMSFGTKDVVHLAVDGVSFDIREKAQNGQTGGFRTDADISGNLAFRERNLQRWEPSTDADIDMSLDAKGGAWDQFQANEQRFGLKTDYDENIYTTSIDKSHPDYRRREAEALRIAQEIGEGIADNAHLREERGISHPEDAMNEEEKYSGVRRQAADYPPLQSNQANRYMPPARRPPTGRPTVAGAPVDPAIISMQMAGAAADQGEKQPAPKGAHNGVEIPAKKPEVSSETETKDVKPASTTINKEASSGASRQLPPIKTSKVGESATANVETELLDSFKQFANMEKMKVHDQRRQRVTHDKNIKLNDLMKFSQNFKLLTPVPKDLVPILAKDKSKQEEIVEKAQRNADSNSTSAKAATISASEPKSSKLAGEGARPAPEVSAPRQVAPPQGPQAAQSSRERPQQLHNGTAATKAGQGLLSHRLADSHRQHRSGLPPMSIPQPIPIQSVSKTARAPVNHNNQLPGAPIRTPTSASSATAKLNVRAMEFRPNPAASSFRPPGEPSAASSSRSTPRARSASRPVTPSAFFGNRRPLPREERETITAHFNPLKFLKQTAQQEGKPYTHNGGIRPAYTTPPTWSTVEMGEEFKSYKQMFDDVIRASDRISSRHGSPSHSSLPHQHQLPMHLQQGSHGISHMPMPQQASFHSQPQAPHFPQGPQHYDDHRMHLSASSSSFHASPRMHSASIAYQSPMPQQAHIAYGQPMPPHYFVGPNGPPQAHFGRQFHHGPQMVPAQGTPLAAPMMVQQSSQGGYIPPPGMTMPYNPQMQMYHAGQPAAYNGHSQPSTNYPSPSRGAPIMMHQGSHQGQPAQVYMNPAQYGQPVYASQQPQHMVPMRGYGSPQPHFNQSPQPQYHYPQPQGRAPSGSYGVQPPQGPHQHIPAQQPPPSGPMDGGEEMK
ncbi:MAG: hypothetical protein LQ348_006362 [Seirophora lacunosa]|nr:MAG: hypothetical protein LQ348_006362 [Seirophora lacunosa]